MNKNTKKILAILLVCVVAVGSYFVASTYAKYTSSIDGNAEASVAKWKWTINDQVFESTSDVTNGYTFNLFQTILDTSDGAAETDVHQNSQNKADKIAPGTKGSFTLDIENNSEVNAEYTIAFTETNASNVPIEYSLDGTNWTSTISTLNVSTPVAINMGASATQKTVYWRWVFEGGNAPHTTENAADTQIGFAVNSGEVKVLVKATVTVSQVD